MGQSHLCIFDKALRKLAIIKRTLKPPPATAKATGSRSLLRKLLQRVPHLGAHKNGWVFTNRTEHRMKAYDLFLTDWVVIIPPQQQLPKMVLRLWGYVYKCHLKLWTPTPELGVAAIALVLARRTLRNAFSSRVMDQSCPRRCTRRTNKMSEMW